MFTRLSTLLIAVLLFSLHTVSNGQYSAPAVQTLTRPQASRILLRWEPSTDKLWLAGLQGGYYVERKTVARNNATVSGDFVRLTAQPVKPAPSGDWSPYLKPDSVQHQALYRLVTGQDTVARGPGRSADSLNQTSRESDPERRFFFGLMAASQSYSAARLAALGYVDAAVQANERYVYRVVLASPPGGVSVNYPASDPVGLADYTPLPAPMRPKLQFERYYANLKWLHDTLKTTFVSYWIERSVNGTTFQRMNDRPYVLLSDVTNLCAYNDPVPKGRRTYYYRIIGKSPFDEVAVSPVSVGESKDTLVMAPRIKTLRIQPDNKVYMSWQFPGDSVLSHASQAGADTLLKSFFISVSAKPDQQAVLAKYGISRNDTMAYVDNYTNKVGGSSTYYFTLGAVRQDGDTLLSASMFVERLDSIPPAVPTGLRGQIDGSGRVYLSWQPNEEPDLLGYKVFRSQKTGEESSAMQDTVLLKRSEFIDQTLINSLNPALYYQVRAIDTRFNESALSAPFRLAKPDAVRPASPAFKSDSLAGGQLRLDWSVSSSPDVVRQWLLRRESDGAAWQRLSSFPASTTTTTDNSIQPGKRYQYLLVAEDQAGLYSDSTAIRRLAIPASQGQQAPVLSAFNALVDSDLPGVRLSWSYEGSNVSEYQLYRASGSKPFGLWRMVSGLEQSTDDEQANQPGTYRYKIQAVFKDGNVSNWQSASAIVSGSASTPSTTGQPYVNQTLTGLTLQVGTAVSYQIPSTVFTAPDGQPIAITILKQGMPAGLVALDQTLSGTPQQAGQYTLTVQGKTSGGYLISTTLPITVGQPAVTSGIPSLTVTAGQPFAYTLPDWLFTGGATKPQVTILPTNVPAGATAIGSQLQGTVSQSGSYVLTVQSVDSLGGQTQTNWRLFVNQPPQPSSALPSVSATQGVYTEWSLPTGLFRDVDGQVVSVRIRAAGIPAGMAIRATSLVGVPTTTGVYTLTLIATDDVGATATATINVQVGQPSNQPPQLTMLAPRVEGLVGDSLRYTVPTGLFYDPDGVIKQISLSGSLPAGLAITGSSIRGIPTQAGSYTLTATATDDRGGSISCPIELTLAAITYTAGFQLTGPATICAGNSAVLTASGCSGSIQWSSGATGQTITVTPVTTTTYSAKCIVTNQTTVAATPLQVVVQQKPAAPQLTGGKVCKGSSITLTANNCMGSVTWGDGSVGPSLVVTPTATTSYSAICSSEGCTSSPGSTTVLVDLTCPASEIYVNCGGSQVTDSTGHVWLADTESSPSIYLKSDAGIGSENSITGSNATNAPRDIFSTNRWSRPREIPLDWAFPVANGSYSVNLYFAEIWDGCQTANCRLAKIYLEGDYIETVDVNANVGFRRPLRKTYTITVSDGLLNLSLMGVTNSAQLSGVSITPASAGNPVTTISAQPSTSLCANRSVILAATDVVAGATVRWSTGATSTSITVGTTGPYSVTVTNQNGTINTGSINVTAAAEPVVSIAGNLTLTAAQSTTLTASSSVDNSRFQWNTGAITAALSVTAAGTYNVSAISPAGCQASASVTVTSSATTTCVAGDPYQLTQSFSSSTPVTISAQKQIATSGMVTVESGASLKLRAPQRIRLLPGFKAKQGAAFNAKIDNCP